MKALSYLRRLKEEKEKIKNEGYLCTDLIFTKCTKNTFTIKAKCSASMKKIKRCFSNTYKKNIQSRKGQNAAVPLVLVVTAII